jgi:hypothetical protein
LIVWHSDATADGMQRLLNAATWDADDLTGHLIGLCGHIIPQHRPDELLALLGPFLAH